ncbi:pyridoxamine 5'-phosphate oxidase family protein [Embleya sp. MST-111070]|uniref:pyridoxamine 5'-phosphate oxidase family protein n=1 Tax=Embleya sp. MST-111070 TaxID=3398231 RepID=UPI003F7341D7
MSEYTTKRPLDREEAWTLMAGVRMGRVVVSEDALPAVHLVAFALDRDCVVFRTRADSPLAKAALDAVVAFQADDVGRPEHAGWTTTVIGHASRVHDHADLARLDRLLPESDDGGKRVWFRVTSEFVTGHLLRPAPGTHASC